MSASIEREAGTCDRGGMSQSTLITVLVILGIIALIVFIFGGLRR